MRLGNGRIGKARLRMWIVSLALVGALVVGGLVLAVFLAQTRLLFPAGIAAANRPDLPPSAERLTLAAADGTQLAGVRLGPSSDAGPLLLGFGGNAWNADAMALTLHALFPEREVV